MKKVLGFVKRNSLTALSFIALFVASVATVQQTIFWTHQVKCPEELLK
ncbi:MAG: cyclic lactone autoinducer peptide [Thermotaleaceae bacterium]